MAFDKSINVGQCCRHAAGEWCVTRGDFQRVHPHDAVGHTAQALHLFGEHIGVAAIPSVRQHHHDCAAGQATHTPAVVERPHTFADAGATAPVSNLLRCTTQCFVGVAMRKLARNAREASAERKRFHPLAAHHCGMHEPQECTGVRLHRT